MQDFIHLKNKLILIYEEFLKKSLQAKNLYTERYSNRIHPSRRIYKNMCDKLKQTIA